MYKLVVSDGERERDLKWLTCFVLSVAFAL